MYYIVTILDYPADIASYISHIGRNIDNARVYHAGTKKNTDGNFVTNGGRVLAVVGRGDTREIAVEHTYP